MTSSPSLPSANDQRLPRIGCLSPLVLALTLAWLTLVLILTLTSATGVGTPAGVARLADLVRNLILFAPLGLLLALSGWSVIAAAIAGALISGAIEIGQIWIPGRHAGIQDVIANASGAGAGATFAYGLIGDYFRCPIRSARLALATGLLGAIVLLLPGLLMRPAPPASLYYPAWTPRIHGYVDFPGTVLQAQIGDLPIEHSGPSERSGDLRERIRDGSTIKVRAVSAGRTLGIAPLIRINDGSWEILLIAVQADDVILRLHSLAGVLGLEEPLFRATGSFASVAPGEVFTLEFLARGLSWQLSAPDEESYWIGPTPGAAWRLLADSDTLPEVRRRFLDALMLALIFVPFAIWFRPRSTGVAGIALLLAAMFVGPGVAGLVRAPPSEWAGVALGLTSGGLLQMWIRRSQGRADAIGGSGGRWPKS